MKIQYVELQTTPQAACSLVTNLVYRLGPDISTAFSVYIPLDFTMELIKFLDLSSLFFGLASSAMFSIGGLTMSHKEIASISQPLYGPNPAVTKSLISQKSQFLLGALLLGISFMLQLAKVLELKPSSAVAAFVLQTHTWHLALAFVIILLCSYLLSCSIIKLRIREIEQRSQ